MKARKANSKDQQVLLDHVRELQKRLVICVILLLAAGTLGYIFFADIVQILKAPLHADLYYNSPSGSFNFVMKVCTMVGIAIALPAIVYNLIMFIRPAFIEVLSIKRVHGLTVLSFILALSGAAFGYYFIVPGALKFFAGFQVSGLSALITADSYLSFVTGVIITFVLVFQIPLLMTLFDKIKPIPPKRLFKMEKYVIVAGLGVSVIVPFAFDLTTCLLIAAPIIVLYNLSIAMIIISHEQTARKARRAALFSDSVLVVEDEVISEFFDYIPSSQVVAQFETIDEPKLSTVIQNPVIIRNSAAVMDVYTADRESFEKMQQTIVLKRQSVVEERERRKHMVRGLNLISDMR
jgi:sec-independent protein translocase protein TatC